MWLILLIVCLKLAHYRYLRVLERGLPNDVTFAKLANRDGIPKELERSLGFCRVDRAALHALPLAHPGTVRIITLGDSYGEGVVGGLDYPALLQRRFARAGMSNVEVINLGGSQLSLGESMRMAEMARRYQPDFVLLGPIGLRVDPDEGFQAPHTPRQAIHGRYILDGDGVRFIDVAGESKRERFDLYHRFVPRLDYLRYDRRPPAFLAAIVGRDGSLENPFYYTRLDPLAEAHELYRRLLSRLAAAGSQLVIADADEALLALAAEVDGPLVSARLPAQPAPVYRRTDGRLSAAGNDALAQLYFEILTDHQPAAVDMVTLKPGDSPAAPPMAKLAEAQTLELAVENQAVARLVSDDDGADLPVNPSARGIRAFLVLTDGEQWQHGIFIPLASVPAFQAPVEFSPRRSTGETRTPFGSLFWPAAPLPIAVARLPEGFTVRSLRLSSTSRVEPGSIFVGREVVAQLRRTGPYDLDLDSGSGPCALLAPLSNDFFDVSALRSGSALELRPSPLPPVAIGTVSQQPTLIPYDARRLHRIIRATHSGRAEVIDR